MIRTEEIVPEWVYQFAGKVPEMKESILNAKALVAPFQVSVDTSKEMDEVWTDGAFGDPFKPLGYVPRREHRKVKVIYWDFHEHGYRFDYHKGKLEYDKLRHRDGVYYEEPMHRNAAWHEWDCVQIEMYIVKHGEKDIYYTLFQDIQDRQWYITYTYMLRLKSGERRA